MTFFDVFIIGLGLSMDAFAVAATNGMTYKPRAHTAALIALAFGFFQALMPLIGYLLGSLFTDFISRFAPIIALLLLGAIGLKMLIEGLKKNDKEEKQSAKFTITVLIVQAVATSIDALAVGVSFVNASLNILLIVCIIGFTTLILSYLAVNLGKKFGDALADKADIVGGLILIGIGVKIFVESLL